MVVKTRKEKEGCTENSPTCRMFEDFDRILEIELLVDNTGGIDLNSVVCQFLLLGIQETTAFRIVREIKEGEDTKGNGT